VHSPDRTTARVPRVNTLKSSWETALIGTPGNVRSIVRSSSGFPSNASRAITISSARSSFEIASSTCAKLGTPGLTARSMRSTSSGMGKPASATVNPSV
jgi:hypothetical protein